MTNCQPALAWTFSVVFLPMTSIAAASDSNDDTREVPERTSHSLILQLWMPICSDVPPPCRMFSLLFLLHHSLVYNWKTPFSTSSFHWQIFLFPTTTTTTTTTTTLFTSSSCSNNSLASQQTKSTSSLPPLLLLIHIGSRAWLQSCPKMLELNQSRFDPKPLPQRCWYPQHLLLWAMLLWLLTKACCNCKPLPLSCGYCFFDASQMWSNWNPSSLSCGYCFFGVKQSLQQLKTASLPCGYWLLLWY